MIKPVTFVMKSCCKECRTNTVNLFDIKNRLINYTTLLNQYDNDKLLNKLDSVTLSHMQCSKCKKVYSIDWTQELPKPLTNKINIF